MKRSVRRIRTITVAVVILVLLAAAAIWDDAVERWIGQELRSLAASHLNPTLDFDDLDYTFPLAVKLRGVRLTSPDPGAPSDMIEILTLDSLTLALSRIPRPNAPFRIQQLELGEPTLHLVRIREEEAKGGLLGFSELLKKKSDSRAPAAGPPRRLSDFFQVDTASIQGGRAQYGPRDGGADTLLIDGITAKLQLRPGELGIYAIDFSLDDHPALTLELRGQLDADDKRLEVASLSSTLQLGGEHDQHLTASLRKLLKDRNVTGRLTLEASGMFDRNDVDSSHLQAQLELGDAGYAARNYGLALDRVSSRVSATWKTLTIEKFAIDALGGHAGIAGSFELDDALTGALTFNGSDLQIGDLQRGADDPHGVPSFSGLLDFTGTLEGPFSDIDQRAQGRGGRLSIRKARLARLPVLSRIDDALDAAAEALLKREHKGHDELSLHFSLKGDRVHIEKLRMNSRWYGLRGHGDVYFDSRLDLAVDGGPVQRVENELGALGDVMGEISETLVRARVTGTLAKPKVGIEVFRHSL